MVELAQLKRREAELMARLGIKRERLLELAVRELATNYKDRGRAGLKPDPGGASTSPGLTTQKPLTREL